jgi:hypothetical protein
VTPETVVGGSIAIVDTDFIVQVHAKATSTSDCVVDRDHKLLVSLPHQHEWGTHFKATVDRVAGGTDTIIDAPFETAWVTHPKLNDYGIATPFLLHKGDTIHLSCEWMNDTTEPLIFPREMCVLFGWTLEEDDAHCTGGIWSHSNP